MVMMTWDSCNVNLRDHVKQYIDIAKVECCPNFSCIEEETPTLPKLLEL